MNNSSITPEPERDAILREEKTSERMATLTRDIEAIQRVRSSEEWSTLKKDIFGSLADKLRRELHDEATKDDPNTNKLNRLTGELKWAERFSDLERWENVLRVELKGIKLRQYGQTE